jgi:hypothetical protein
MVNHTNNFPSLETVFASLGSTAISDLSRIAINTPTGLIGLLLNIVGLRVLFKAQFKSIRLNSYFKIYLLNSAIIFLLGSGLMMNSRRYININSYLTNFYVIYIYTAIIGTCYFYGSMLDILIILNSISLITNKTTQLNKVPTYALCLIFLAACIIVNLPQYFAFSVA